MRGTRRTLVTAAASVAVVLGIGGVAAATNGHDTHSVSTAPSTVTTAARSHGARLAADDDTSSTTVADDTSTTVADPTPTTTVADDTSTTVGDVTTTTLAPTTSTTVEPGDHHGLCDHGKRGPDADHNDGAKPLRHDDHRRGHHGRGPGPSGSQNARRPAKGSDT